MLMLAQVEKAQREQAQVRLVLPQQERAQVQQVLPQQAATLADTAERLEEALVQSGVRAVLWALALRLELATQSGDMGSGVTRLARPTALRLVAPEREVSELPSAQIWAVKVIAQLGTAKALEWPVTARVRILA